MAEEDLKKQLEALEQEKARYLEGWKRAQADFLNYKKEELERLALFKETVTEELLRKFLVILDHFDQAEKLILPQDREKEVVKGFLQIKKELEKFFKDHGIERMEVLGKKFDPNFHEALEVVEDKSKESGLIVEEMVAGYMKGQELFRPAKVKIIK